MNIKVKKLFDRHITSISKIVKKEFEKAKAKGGFGWGRGPAGKKRGIAKRKKIFAFYLKNDRWPKRTSTKVIERSLGISFENFICPNSKSYDKNMRRMALALGRISNNKKRHNPAARKEEILQYIRDNGSVPGRYDQYGSKQGAMHAKIDYYVGIKGDMSFLGEIYKLDKCHRSGIPMRYRPIINATVVTEAPLVNMSNRSLSIANGPESEG